MIVWHYVRVTLHLLAGLMTCAFLFPLCAQASREKLVQRWSRQLLGICTVDVRFIDQSDGKHAERALIVSNHISWLDIFVINTLHPCHFVAKADIRSWPLVGWLCHSAGTIFLARGKQREVRRIYEGLVHQIEAGKRIAFFPEGTTAAQGTVLPFHANLFEAAIEAKVPVQPFALRYVDQNGHFHHAADFIGDMTFAESMKVILKPPRMTAELIRLPAISTDGAHRREVASQSQQAVRDALGIQASQAA